MIRFIDVTKDYFCNSDGDPELESPICSFIDTVTDKYVSDSGGGQVFHHPDDIETIPDPELRHRCLRQVPTGFFDRDSDYWKRKKGGE